MLSNTIIRLSLLIVWGAISACGTHEVAIESLNVDTLNSDQGNMETTALGGYCEAIPTQQICNTQSACMWNGTQCVTVPIISCNLYATSYIDVDGYTPLYSNDKNLVERISYYGGSTFGVTDNWSIRKGEQQADVFNDIAMTGPDNIRVTTGSGHLKKLRLNSDHTITIENSIYTSLLDSGVFFGDFFASYLNAVYSVPLPSSFPLKVGDGVKGGILDVAVQSGAMYYVELLQSNGIETVLGYINQLNQYIKVGPTKTSEGRPVRITGLANVNGILFGLGQDRILYAVDTNSGILTVKFVIPPVPGLSRAKGFGLAAQCNPPAEK